MSIFSRCPDDIKDWYLSFSSMPREYQATLEGPLEYCALDLETTGFSPERDRIIEIAAARVVDDRITERCHSLIDPGCRIPAFVRELTGIDEEMVSGSPTLEDFFGEVVDFIGERPVLAYSRLEEDFLRYLYPTMGNRRFANQYIDAMDLAIMLLPSLRGHRQIDLASVWDIDCGSAHRAMDDVETLVSVFEMLLNGLYNIPLSVIGAVLDHAPEPGGGFSGLLRRVYRERSGGREVEKLDLDTVVRRDPYWEKVPPLEGEGASGSVPRGKVREIFEAGGPISRQFEDYEVRDEQLQMADAVLEAFKEKSILLVEAGTGTGKSLAYLAPAVLWSRATELPVVVSTRTLNLQDQLFTKDLPLLESALGQGSFRYTLLKGYSNYLCTRKLQSLINSRKVLPEYQLGILGMLLMWVTETETGDLSMLNITHLRGLQGLVRANYAECPVHQGKRCRFADRGDCFYRKALYRAKRSNIVAVNHSLLLSGIDLNFRCAIVDEAHTLEDVATETFTDSFEYRDVTRFLKSLHSPSDGSGLLVELDREAEVLDAGPRGELEAQAEEAREAVEICLEDVEKMFVSLSGIYGGRGGDYGSRDVRFSAAETESVEYLEFYRQAEVLESSLDRLTVRLDRVKSVLERLTEGPGEMGDIAFDVSGAFLRVAELKGVLGEVIGGSSPDIVKWATVSAPDRFEYQGLNATPVDVGEHLAAMLYEELDTVVMTSATLTVKEVFDFFCSRVGLGAGCERRPELLVLDSSFDFERQMQILLLHDMPDPRSEDYRNIMADVLGDVIVAAGGGALVLFTNRRFMLDTYDRLVDRLRSEGLTLLCQRPGHSRRRLAEEFVEDESASLFGTTSFWEGVDARGSTLKLVVVTRIPFESPGRPVFEARGELVKMEGGSDFFDLSLPLAALRLKQGVGRLIRTRQDRGQVLIMDSRVNTMKYGQVLLRSLPHGTRRRISCEEVGRAISSFEENA